MKKIIILIVLVLVCNVSFSQTLEKKWNYMLKKSNSYKSHKVIKEEELTGMWEVLQDSMLMMKIKLKQEQSKVADQKQEIASLKKQVQETNTKLDQVTQEKSNVIASGARTGQYIKTLWIALGLIVLVCIVLFILYKRSNSITEQKRKDYDLLSKSFEEYKMNKIEVERKLKREIQTYVNKIEELKN